MSRTLKITDNTDEVDLINTSDTGIILSRGGGPSNAIRPNLEFSSSSLTNGANLRLKNYSPVTDRYTLNLKGSSHDNAAAQLQALDRLLRKADQFRTTAWQQSPVYIQEQTTNESNPRYSLIVAWTSQDLKDFFDTPFDNNNEIDDFTIFITREPFWRSAQPGFLPFKEPLQSPANVKLDMASGLLGLDSITPTWDKINLLPETATPYDFDSVTDTGASITVANHVMTVDNEGVTAAALGNLSLAAVDQASFSSPFRYDPNSFGIGTGSIFIFMARSGTASVYLLKIDTSSSPYLLTAQSRNDANALIDVGTHVLSDEKHDIFLTGTVSTGPGNNDGTMYLFVDGVLVASAINLDNDTHDLDLAQYGTVSSSAGTPTGSHTFEDIYLDTIGAPYPAACAVLGGGKAGMIVPIFEATAKTGTTTQPSNDTELTRNVLIDPNTLAMATDDIFVHEHATGSGSGGVAWQLELGFDGTDYFLRASYFDDAGSATALTDITITDAPQKAIIEWKASTADGDDNGTFVLTVGKTTVSATGIDNDGHDIDSIVTGLVSGRDSGTVGLLFADRLLWTDAVPATKWLQQHEFEQTFPFIANYRHDNILTHIFNEDNSLAAFSANFVFDFTFTYLEVSGSTPANDDATYFGGDDPFYNIVLNFISSGDTDGTSWKFEYWNGSAWTDSGLSVNGLYFETSFLGPIQLNWGGASDWAKTTVNGENKYWVRLRLNLHTSWTTSPVQGNQLVYTPNDTYFEFASDQIVGDVGAMAFNRMFNFTSKTNKNIFWIALGAKTRGLTTFTGRLNAGGQNPTSWAESYFTDTAQTADTTAPGGNNATCDFATNQTLQQRLSIFVTDADIETDFEGSYRVYLRAKQVNGSAGDVSVQLKYARSITIAGEVVKMKGVDAGPELIDLGQFDISASDSVKGDEVARATGLTFAVWAQSDNGTTPDLEIHDLVFIPIDEMALVISSSGKTGQDVPNFRGTQIDAGILREKTNQLRWGEPITLESLSPQVISDWETRGALPLIEPRRQTRIYYLLAYDNSGVLEADHYLGMGGNLHVHEQWISLRGDD